MSTSAVNRARVLAAQLNEFPEKPVFQPGDQWTNWAGVGSCHPAHHHYPSTVDDVIRLIRRSASPSSIRVAGAGLSPNSATFTPQHLIHMERLCRLLELDEKAMTVTCEAGIKLSALVADLQLREYTLPVIPSVLDMTLGGAIANAAHGTGLSVKTISGYVCRLVVIDGNGIARTVDESTPIPPSVEALLPPPQSNTPHRLLDAFACSLGVLGVIVSVTLRIERICNLHVIERPALLSELSMDLVNQRATMNDYYRFHWVPHTEWCTEALGRRSKAADDEGISSKSGTTQVKALPRPANGQKKGPSRANNLSTATAPTLLKAPLDGLNKLLDGTSEVPRAMKKDLVERMLASATRAPTLQPYINRAYHAAFMSDRTERVGPPHETLVLDCLFRQHAMEFAVDVSRWRELFDATQDLIRDHRLYVHFPVEVRFADAEPTWLAPNSARKTCYIGIVMYRPKGRDSPHWREYYDRFERAATQLGGRPHWAKSFSWRRPQFEAAYPCFRAFVALQQLMDPRGVFVNEWYKQIVTAPL